MRTAIIIASLVLLLMVGVVIFVTIQPVETSDFTCPYCGQHFSSDIALQTHILLVHTITPKEKLLVIVDDALAENSKLAQCLASKSGSYDVVKKTVSEIPSISEARSFLKLRVSDIQSVTYSGASYDQLDLAVSVLGTDGRLYYQRVIVATSSGWHVINNFGNELLELSPILGDLNSAGPRSFTITYSGGSVTVSLPDSVPRGYTMWGDTRILTSGELAFKRNRADDVYDYINSINPRYVLLVGRVPAFHSGCYSNAEVDTVTDHPYMCANIYSSNMQMVPSRIVGRLPSRSSAELDVAMDKLAAWNPRQTGRAFLWQTYEDSRWYDSLLGNLSSFATITSLTFPTKDEVISTYSSEFDFVIAYAHGSGFDLTPLGTYDFSSLHSSKSNMVWAIACSTTDFTQFMYECPGELFMDLASTGTACYFGCSLPPSALSMVNMCVAFFQSSGSIGERYLNAKIAAPGPEGIKLFNRLTLQFFGDPTAVW